MPKSHSYYPFGIKLNSDIELPELPPAVENHEPSAWVKVGSSNKWPYLEDSIHSTSSLKLAPGEWQLTLEGIGRFRASSGVMLEWERWNDSVSDRDLRTFLLTSGIGILAIQRGQILLHATALEKNGAAILILGHPTSGKSTLAWLLLEQGWNLVSSEISNIDQSYNTWPGQQQLKLWNDAVTTLRLDWNLLQPVRNVLKRQAILPPLIGCSKAPVMLKDVYVLRRGKLPGQNANAQTSDQIEISEALPHKIRMRQLNDHLLHARSIRGMKKEFETFIQIAGLANGLSMRYLLVPDDIQKTRTALQSIDLLNPTSSRVLNYEEQTDG